MKRKNLQVSEDTWKRLRDKCAYGDSMDSIIRKVFGFDKK